MSWKWRMASVALAAAASALVAQETPPATSTTTTQTTATQNPDGSTTTQQTTTQTNVTGEVVQYEPGQSIVIRDKSKTTTYTLDGGLVVPGDVQVGRRVTVYSSPVDGSIRVQKITMVEATAPDGSKSTRTEVRDEAGTPPPAPSMTTKQTTQAVSESAMTATDVPVASTRTTQTTTKTTAVSGTVRSYEPGQSITVVGPGNKVTTYTITTDSQLPQDVAVGKAVTVQTTMVSGKPVVRSVTSKTTTKTKTTRAKTISPQ